jgi:hypothetical protein
MDTTRDSALSLDARLKSWNSGLQGGNGRPRRAEIAQWIDAMCEANRDRCGDGIAASMRRRWWDHATDVVSLMFFGLTVNVSSDERNSERLARHMGINQMDYDVRPKIL